MKKSDPYYCLACNGPCGYGKPVRPTKKGRTRMKKAIVTTAILLLLPTVALATGLPAPLQAQIDASAICEGPVGPMLLNPGGIAGGYCASLGLTDVVVFWRCDVASGRREVIRVGLDTGWREVPGYVTALTDRELCK